jgi:hypothetical protein
MKLMDKPWASKDAFTRVHALCGTWTGMAAYWVAAGYQTTEATVRRWADVHGINSNDAKSPALKDENRDLKNQIKILEKTIKNTTKEYEKKLQEIESLPRDATPEELVSAEKELEKARARANRFKVVAQSLARGSNFVDEVKEELQGCLDEVSMEVVSVKPPKPPKNDDPVSLVLGLSDIHWGDTVDSDTVNGLNNYNPNIACLRLERVVDVTTAWAHNYSAFSGVDELVLLLNGDNINNAAGLHPEESTDYAKVCKQVLDSALVLSQVIMELSQIFPKVRVVAASSDNHSRSTKKSATSSVARATSWNTMLNELIAAYTNHLPNIEYEFGTAYLTLFGVKGFTWALSHGHFIKGGSGNAGVPLNGLKKLNDVAVSKSVTNLRNADFNNISTLEEAIALIRSVVSVVLVGHHHQSALAQFNGSEGRIMPSLKGPDTYSLDVLNKYNPPAQSLFAVSKKHGIIGDHTINVQDIRQEGNTRYTYGALESSDPAVVLLGK